MVPKSEFKRRKHDVVDCEPFVICVKCGIKQHQICAMHLDEIYGQFVCNSCLSMTCSIRPENLYTARNLPVCKLSEYVEERVNGYLATVCSDSVPRVLIRVLNSSEKRFFVKPLMKSRYSKVGQFPDSFPYRSKCFFAFQATNNGDEICFFGVYVQEYGSDCPQPNSRRVYISYLDSVFYFQPKHLRTAVYQEILMGYLDHCKNLGYLYAHLSACPPPDGEDYIFYCHPAEQKMPDSHRLQEWYFSLFTHAKQNGIIEDFKSFCEDAEEKHIASVTELPYLEDDYWPSVVEYYIDDLECYYKQRLKPNKKLHKENNKTQTIGKADKEKVVKKHSKTKRDSLAQLQAIDATLLTLGTSDELVGMVMKTVVLNKNMSFVVRLQSSSPLDQSEIIDPDPILRCELMEDRDWLSRTFRDRHWEFSSLRRAAFSTMALCYELHIYESRPVNYRCDKCYMINAAWHCSVCKDFDLCHQCYKSEAHEHQMQRTLFFCVCGDPDLAAIDSETCTELADVDGSHTWHCTSSNYCSFS